ncbi:MAG: hypothetical protein ACFFDJ_10330 [Candidatus Odinarchaeota archaeon]
MNWSPRHTRFLIAIIIGTIIGIFCSWFFANLLYLPLLIMCAALIVLFCKSAPDIPPEEEEEFYAK